MRRISINWRKTVFNWLRRHVRGSSHLQFTGIGLNGQVGVPVPSLVAQASRAAGDLALIQLLVMAVAIVLESRLRPRDVAWVDVQSMVPGVIGLTGVLAVSPAEAETESEQELAPILHRPSVD